LCPAIHFAYNALLSRPGTTGLAADKRGTVLRVATADLETARC